MSLKPVALILGSGPRVGAAVAKQFGSTGYSVAIASRKAAEGKTAEGYLSIKADFSDPSSVLTVFDTVKAEFQSSPTVVVYNAAALTPPNNDDLFSIPAKSLAADLNTNTISAYVAAQEAVKGWETLTQDARKLFIYTGNKANAEISPRLPTVTLGIGKSASSYLIGAADNRYSKDGYRFFYADERTAEGGIKGMELDGEAHAEFYAQLASGTAEVPWHATFVKGKGYVKF
ncbi:NAD(P)-binding protein [Lophiostoma macrostomum CBS 122681]|uniref:NAD(P)-binding protein n=1 Tax=Lophiostoma macrostomum CBS 122681 TaxID=1314788 RepID=A0A6A6SPA0_9PLEO|nr:NAD(P)-binding protein [Lophiostoma macrostomum CBS 122681]